MFGVIIKIGMAGILSARSQGMVFLWPVHISHRTENNPILLDVIQMDVNNLVIKRTY